MGVCCGAHCSSVVDRTFCGIDMSKEEADIASCRESITSKLQPVEETVVDMEDVSVLKTIELFLGKVCEGTKEKFLGGRAKKRASAEETTHSHKRWSGTQGAPETSAGVSVSGDARVGKPKFSVPDNIFAEFEYQPSGDG